MTKTFVVALVVCALGFAVCGAPMFLRGEKDRSMPFPCQDRPCGCGDAKSCWKQCCCFTPAQKLAWAKRHGVTPPAAAIRAARASVPSQMPATDACCEKGHRDRRIAPTLLTRDPPVSRLVLSDDYRHCRGQSPLWLMVRHALPAKSFPPVLAGEASGWVATLAERATALSRQPETPPPKSV